MWMSTPRDIIYNVVTLYRQSCEKVKTHIIRVWALERRLNVPFMQDNVNVSLSESNMAINSFFCCFFLHGNASMKVTAIGCEIKDIMRFRPETHLQASYLSNSHTGPEAVYCQQNRSYSLQPTSAYIYVKIKCFCVWVGIVSNSPTFVIIVRMNGNSSLS